MKAGEVLKILQIGRSTLKKYRELGYIKARKLPTGQYDFDKGSVYLFRNGKDKRLTISYARVLNHSYTEDIHTQEKYIQNYAKLHNIVVDQYLHDYGNGLTTGKNKYFKKLLDLILDGQVKLVIVVSKDRVSRDNFELFQYLCDKYNTDIKVLTINQDKDRNNLEVLKELNTFVKDYD